MARLTDVEIQNELAALLGRTVDLGLRHSLRPAIREAVLASDRVVYLTDQPVSGV